jgi:tetratricopeptide (TPR) repeat protein
MKTRKQFIMKQFVFRSTLPYLCFFLLFAACQQRYKPNNMQFDYSALWQKVDSLEYQAALPQSALETVEGIYQKALKDNNTENRVRAVMYKAKYAVQLNEEGFMEALQLLENEILIASEPDKQILHSFTGEILNGYYQSRQYEILPRTEIAGDQSKDIRTWSAAQFERSIYTHYNESLRLRQISPTTPLSGIGTLLQPIDTTFGKAITEIWPSLQDVLLQRALAYYSNTRSMLTLDVAREFRLTDQAALAPVETFVKHQFKTPDTSALLYRALTTHQSILAKNIAEKNTKGLIINDLYRIRFAKNQLEMGPNERYEQAIELYNSLLKEHKASDYSGFIAHELATIYLERGGQYQPQDVASEVYRKDYAAAVEVLRMALKSKQDPQAAALCRAQLEPLVQPNITVITESPYLVEKPGLFGVGYKEVGTAYFRVVQWSDELQKQHDQMGEPAERWSLIQKQATLKNWKKDFKKEGDYHQHNTELALPALPRGKYLLVASLDAQFENKTSNSAAQFQVSDVQLMTYAQVNTATWVAIDRKTGAPIANADITLYAVSYGYNPDFQEIREKLREGKTDAQGMFQSGSVGMDKSLVAVLNHQGELVSSQNTNAIPPPQPYTQEVVHFFTDRALYRPGQNIYFKGLVMRSSNTSRAEIIPNKTVVVKLMDANFKEVSQVSLVSNAFGSIQGGFTAPVGGLTGAMQIIVEGISGGGSTGIQVEEYKRPRFEVTIETPAQQVVVGDEVRMIGKAANYAGNAADGAKVSYTVTRRTAFPFCGWWRWRPNVPDVVMASGEAVTDAEGKFEVKFAAGAPTTTQKRWQPIFTYELVANVTDISGETRMGVGSVQVGYQTILVENGIIEAEEMDSLRKVQIRTSDLNGNPLAAKGTITVEQLDLKGFMWHDRVWQQPDVWMLTEADYRRDHPAFGYETDLDPAKYKIVGAPYMLDFQTDTTGAVVDLVTKSKMSAGQEYRITTKTTDAKGRETVLVQMVKVLNKNLPEANVKILEVPYVTPEQAQASETAKVWMGGTSGVEQYFVVLDRPTGTEPAQWVATPKGAARSVSITMRSTDVDNVTAHVIWLRHGFPNHRALSVQLYDPSREINISYETFRDKLTPGARETWKLRVSGKNKDAVAAEMLASMYDASLDQFLQHNWWQPAVNGSFYSQIYPNWMINSFYGQTYNAPFPWLDGSFPTPPDLQNFNFPVGYSNVVYGSIDPETYEEVPGRPMRSEMKMAKNEAMDSAVAGNVAAAPTAPIVTQTQGGGTKPPTQSGMRTNLKETVFFMPQLQTDKNGDVIISFGMNDALTRWKFMAFAHTKDLKMALSTKEVVTQKQLMVLPNQPRFMRAGDTFGFSGKVSNLTAQTMSGKATLELMDAITMQSLNKEFGLTQNSMSFEAKAGQSVPVSFQIKVPDAPSTQTVVWQMRAESGAYIDGEESLLPVVQNRMLVTETMPLTVRAGQTRQFDFSALRQMSSSTLVNHQYTVEFTSNPAWYAVRALPYLMEYPHECSEQIFSRVYANTLASTVANRYPAIGKVYEKWRANGTLQSNLTKNQELKSALLAETPWVLEAQNEAQQQQQIALLFDLNRMAADQNTAITTLLQRQNGEGAWPWFTGGRSDEFITRYIVTGFRRLRHLGAQMSEQNQLSVREMETKAERYLDAKMLEKYNKWLVDTKNDQKARENYKLDATDLYHLYMHSFEVQAINFPGNPPYSFYLDQLKKSWQSMSLYEQGLSALVAHRFGETAPAEAIVKSLKERALKTDELGMYWPYQNGYYWYQMPIETQALMVEVFQEVAKDPTAADEIRIWLLKNKQTTNWKTTKETAEAVYAFLMGNEKWIAATGTVQAEVGQKKLQPQVIEEGTGYFKQTWHQTEVKRELGNIKVTNPNQAIAWGAAYWQYFEELDKIRGYNTAGLGIKKEVYKVVNNQLTALSDGNALAPGDQLKVRIIITADRQYEYVHLKDMRAAGFEPKNALSGYRWSGSLGYYESTKDLASHFFIDNLSKGTHVFEYPLVVNLKGDFNNGITTIQCMYAPEFGGHSKGIRLKVD